MTGSHGSLPAFARAESLHFGRLLVAMMILVGVISLPATVVVLGLLPGASGHLVVAMASLVLITTGAWDGASPDGNGRSPAEEPVIDYEGGRDAIFIFAVVYVVFAGMFSTVLVASAGLGYVVAQSGFPAAGLVAAAGFPFLDRWMAGVDGRFSVVNGSEKLMESLLRCISIIYSLPASLGEDVREQRRNIY